MSAAVLAGAAVLVLHSDVHAQGANVDVTVTPGYTAGQAQPARDGFLVCVGTAADRDQHGSEITPANGVANRNFTNLPVGAQVVVTVNKAGYTGIERIAVLQSGWNNHLQVAPQAGTGGPACPGFVASTPPTGPSSSEGGARQLQISGIPTLRTAGTSTSPTPARLGEQILMERGNFMLHPDHFATLDCKRFGSSYVMVGVNGKHGQGVDQLQVECKELKASSGLSATTQWSPRWGGNDGNVFERRCGAGKVVSGIRGTIDRGQVRSVILDCKTISASGLTTGSPSPLVVIGGQTGSSWPADSCAEGRPARALRVSKDIFSSGIPLGSLFAPWVIGGVQLICEQPVVS